MTYRFYIADVFTDTRFGGNQLAVLTDARGLSGERMQAIAREFGFSETTFVTPTEREGCTHRVRIFTPTREMPFAGHPNVGTAFVLAAIGEVAPGNGEARVVFDEGAGPVPVVIRFEDGKPVSTELTAPVPPTVGEAIDVAAVAAALGIEPGDIVTAAHAPVGVSVGVDFVVVEVTGLDALGRAGPDPGRFARSLPEGARIGVHVYTRETGEADVDVRCRMFAPLSGVAEDAATGSANCALAGLLASLAEADGEHVYRIVQGVEMGRPSKLLARVERTGGAIAAVHMGGASVLVADGNLDPGGG